MGADYALGSTIDFKFTSRDIYSGIPVNLASGAVAAYPDNSTSEITAGITLSGSPFDSIAGLNNVRVVATSGNGYAAGVNYSLVLTAGTVDGVSVVGEVVGEFSIEAQSALRPTVAGKTLDVSNAGNAGIDWGNVENPTTVVDLSGTTIKTATDIATLIGALNNLSQAEVSAAVSALLTATLPDSIPADGTRPSIASGILMMTRFLMEKSLSGLTLTVYKEDGTTANMTFTLDSATAPTSITRTT